MEFIEKVIIEHYKFVLVFLALIIYTYKYFSKGQQLKNERLVIEEFYKNNNAKSVHLKNSKIQIDTYDTPNYSTPENNLNLKKKESELTVKHRKSSES